MSVRSYFVGKRFPRPLGGYFRNSLCGYFLVVNLQLRNSALLALFSRSLSSTGKSFCVVLPLAPPISYPGSPGLMGRASEVGGLSSTGKSFRVVRACVRAVPLPSGIQVKMRVSPFSLSLFPPGAFPFPPPHNLLSSSAGLIGIPYIPYIPHILYILYVFHIPYNPYNPLDLPWGRVGGGSTP